MNYDVISGLSLAIVGAGASLMAYGLGLGNSHEPGSGFVPFAAAALLCIMSSGLVIRSSIGRRAVNQRGPVFQGARWRNLILVVCALLGYGVAFNTLGFSICNFLFMMLLLWQVGRKRWGVVLVGSALIVAAVYLIFVYWLACEFPKGLIGI